MSVAEILWDAEKALERVAVSEPEGRLLAVARFMKTFEDLAKELDRTGESWDVVRPWAQGVCERVQVAWQAFGEWEGEMGALIYMPSCAELDAERALEWRSQHAFVREAFRGTSVDEMLAESEDAEFDEDLRESSEDFGHYAPPYVPASHTWWRRASDQNS